MPYAYLEVTDKLALLFVQHPSIRLPTCHSKTQGETVRFQVSLEPTKDRSTLRITKIKKGWFLAVVNEMSEDHEWL